jgi:hypothetical protein
MYDATALRYRTRNMGVNRRKGIGHAAYYVYGTAVGAQGGATQR